MCRNPNSESLGLPAWPPVSANRSPHMSLGRTIELKDTAIRERAELWDGIYGKHYRAPIPPIVRSGTSTNFSNVTLMIVSLIYYYLYIYLLLWLIMIMAKLKFDDIKRHLTIWNNNTWSTVLSVFFLFKNIIWNIPVVSATNKKMLARLITLIKINVHMWLNVYIIIVQ